MKAFHKLLGIDFETGEDFHKGKEENFITEAGFALADSRFGKHGKSFGIMDAQSLLMNAQKPLAEKVVRLTHINQEMVNEYGYTEEYVAQVLAYQVSRADYLVAHNCTFDKYYLVDFLKKFGYVVDKPWIDTMTDVPYPDDCYDRSLLYLAAYHKIINYHPHRGLPDVMTMFTILENYDIDQVIANSHSPKVAIVGLTSPDQNELLKQHRFRWYGKDRTDCDPQLCGWWAKECKQWELERLTKDLPFRYDVVKLSV